MDSDTLESLQFENSKVRAELRAQKAVCDKLRREKENALQAYAEALEDIRCLHKKQDMQERAFQDFRESREKKIAELIRINQNLEKMLRGGVVSGEEMADLPVGQEDLVSQWPQLSAGELVESLSKWDGMEDITSLFEHMVQREKASLQWTPGSPWKGAWQFVIRMYVSASVDTWHIVEQFLKEGIDDVREVCKQGGCCLMPVVVNSLDMHSAVSEEKLVEVCVNEAERSHIFVGFLGSSVDKVTKTEFEHGYLNNPSLRPAVFAFLHTASEDAATRKLQQRVKNVRKNAKIISREDIERTLAETAQHLQALCLEEVGVPGDACGENESSMFSGVALSADMRREWEQAELLSHYITEAPPTLIGKEDILGRLNSYLREEDSIQACLVTGEAGFGMTTCIAKWIEFVRGMFGDHALVFHHFVQHHCSSSAEPNLILRRFIQKMMAHCGDSEDQLLLDTPTKMADRFVSWLQKLSANLSKPGPEMAILVIDRVDLVTDFEREFRWVLSTLPSNVRVVLTACEDSCPDSWRILPSPTLPTSNASDLTEIIPLVQSRSKTERLSDDQVGLLALAAPSVLLWGIFATKYILSMDSCKSIDDEIECLEEFEELPELVKHILDEVEASNPFIAETMEKLLQLVYWSRDGLLLTEIEQITKAPPALLSLILFELRRRSLVSDVTGLVQFSHLAVQEAIELKYCTDPMIEYSVLWGEPLMAHFSQLSLPGCLLSRCAEELPWLLKRAELKEELFHTVIGTDMLIQLYASGRSGELFIYWQFLDPTLSVMAAQYSKSLLKLEEQDVGDSMRSLIASLYGTVGKIIRNLDFIDEALVLLQRSLDMHESHYDPDEMDMGLAMCELAVLYTQAGRHSSAEGYCKQALQTLESACGEESREVLKVLDIMLNVYEALHRDELADSLRTKVFSVRQALGDKATPSGLLKTSSGELEQFCLSTDDNFLEAAQRLNQLGVIFANYGDTEAAEDLLMRSMKAYENLVAEDDLVMCIPLRNLGTFYMQSDRLDWAVSLLEPALEILSKHASECDPRNVDTINKLGLLYREQGRFDLAEPLHSELVRLKEKEYGSSDLRVGKALNNLAVLCCLQGSYDRALPLYDRAIKIYKEHLGAEHQTVMVALRNRQMAVDSLQPSHT